MARPLYVAENTFNLRKGDSFSRQAADLEVSHHEEDRDEFVGVVGDEAGLGDQRLAGSVIELAW